MPGAPASVFHETPAPISEEELAKFCEFFYRKTGIMFADNKRYFIERRLQDRIAETASESFRIYFSMIRFQNSAEEISNSH